MKETWKQRQRREKQQGIQQRLRKIQRNANIPKHDIVLTFNYLGLPVSTGKPLILNLKINLHHTVTSADMCPKAYLS